MPIHQCNDCGETVKVEGNKKIWELNINKRTNCTEPNCALRSPTTTDDFKNKTTIVQES